MTQMSQEEINKAFLEAAPIIGTRYKFWSERSLKEKILFWTKPKIFDRALCNKIIDATLRGFDFLNDILPSNLK